MVAISPLLYAASGGSSDGAAKSCAKEALNP